MHRKIELQSPADYTYLYANTVTASRQKLDLHFPPSATGHGEPDPMRERVRELVDEVFLLGICCICTDWKDRGLIKTVYHKNIHISIAIAKYQRLG